MKKYLDQVQNEEIKTWINSNLRNYLKNHVENQGEIEHILDFFQSDQGPRRLRKMSYEEAKCGAEKWVASMVKKGYEVVETESDIEVVIDFEDGFKLVKLVASSAYKREGALMSHCVASYVDRACTVYSLRDGRNMPHCTLEVTGEGDKVNQIKGKGNGSVHPKYIKYIIDCLDHFGLEVKKSEMGYLGYDVLEDGWLEFLEKSFEGVKWLSFGGDRYFYKFSKLVRR